MSATLLLAGLRIPVDVAAAVVPSLQAPALRRVIARASRGTLTSDDSPHAWLLRHVFERAPGGTAPYAYANLAGHSPSASVKVWYAEPIHLELARDHLVAMPVEPRSTPDEAAALLTAANEIVDMAGARFERAADNCFLLTPSDWQLDTTPLERIWHSALPEVLPRGSDAQQWSRLLNEIQMAWHMHPVNAAREARGEATINSVWLHGGGAWARLPALPYSAVAANAPDVRGAADAAGIPTMTIDGAWPDGALVVCSDALAARALHDWPAWQAAVQANDARLGDRIRTTALDVVLTGLRSTLSLRLRRSDRLKFWRARPLEEVLSE